MGPTYGGGGVYGNGGGSILGVRTCGTPTCTGNGSQVTVVSLGAKDPDPDVWTDLDPGDGIFLNLDSGFKSYPEIILFCILF